MFDVYKTKKKKNHFILFYYNNILFINKLIGKK